MASTISILASMASASLTPAHPQEPRTPFAPPGPRTRPLLLVDVDGVLSVYGGATTDGLIATLVDGIPHWLSPRAAAALAQLTDAFECVWCTGWKDRADHYLPHLLGLPRAGRTSASRRARPSTGS